MSQCACSQTVPTQPRAIAPTGAGAVVLTTKTGTTKKTLA